MVGTMATISGTGVYLRSWWEAEGRGRRSPCQALHTLPLQGPPPGRGHPKS